MYHVGQRSSRGKAKFISIEYQSLTVCTILYKVWVEYMRFNGVARRISKNNFSLEAFLEIAVGGLLKLYLFVIYWKENVGLKNPVSDKNSFTIKPKAVGVEGIWLENAHTSFFLQPRE